LPCAGQQPNQTPERLPNGTARLVTAISLMAVGRQWVIPPLEGIAKLSGGCERNPAVWAAPERPGTL
jgi:hypothetical protein